MMLLCSKNPVQNKLGNQLPPEEFWKKSPVNQARGMWPDTMPAHPFYSSFSSIYVEGNRVHQTKVT